MAETDIKSINGRVVHDATARESAKKAQESADGAVKSVNGAKPDESGNVKLEKSEVGLGNVDNVKQYSASNPPPYPVTSVNGKTGAVSLGAADVGARPSTWTPTASEVGALPATTKIPEKTSDITNDSGFITRLVADLANYYAKSDTYTRAEINALVSAIPKFGISVVDALPASGISETTVYLVKSGSDADLYTEYIYVNSAWEILGSQRVDLTGYATETWVNTKLADYLTADKLTAEIIAAVLGYTPADEEDVSQLSEAIADLGGAKAMVDNAVGATYAPAQKAASPDIDGYDIDVLNATADDIHTYIDNVVSDKNTVTKEILGKDASSQYDITRYIYANREYCAWVRENYPKLYGWKNGDSVLYTESVSPRVGDKAYNVPYIGGSGTSIETVTEPAVCGFLYGQRYSSSSGAFTTSNTESSLIIPIEVNSENDSLEITVEGAFYNAGRSFYYGETNTAFPNTATSTLSNSNKTVTLTGIPVGKWFVAAVFVSSSLDVTDATTVPTLTGTINGDSFGSIALGTSSATHATTTTTEVETEGGTPITEVRVATVPSGATTNTVPSSRIVGGVEYVRSEADDVEPTVIYTDADDDRNSNTSITQDGIIYYRYPLGDLGANKTKLIPIFIYANEHGIDPARLDTSNAMYQKYETKMAALVAARFICDLADGKQKNNPIYRFIREKCILIVIPVANPYGYNMNITGDTNVSKDGYYNKNNVNINRNYDTPGWVITQPSNAIHHGSYPGSENETQYVMNTMVESGAVVAMSLHGIGGFFNGTEGTTGYGRCAHQGQNPDGSHYDKTTMDIISNFLRANYGYEMVYYDRREEDNKTDFEQPDGESVNQPDRSCKSPSYITYCGAYGGIIEFQPDDIKVSGYQQTYKGYIIENAYAQMLNLTAMWLSDYLDANQQYNPHS